jgi:hypothetical protein
MADSVKISGFIVLFAGVGVLLFTFYDAYLLLTGVLNISGSGDLMQLFGVALAPLITSAIRALYLGIMGWIGSILTRRGVQTLTFEREETKEKAKPKSEAAKETKETEEKKETKETKEPEKPVEPKAAETKQ